MAFNVVADPLGGYFYKMYLLGVPQELSAALAKMSTLTTSVNAVVAVIASSVFYLALRPALKKAGLFVEVTPEGKDNSKKDEGPYIIENVKEVLSEEFFTDFENDLKILKEIKKDWENIGIEKIKGSS